MNSLVYKLNPKWATQIGDSLTTLTDSQIKVSNNSNYIAISYWCNPSHWNSTYVTSNDQEKGIWSIGTAPVEMLLDSFNAKTNNSYSTDIGTYSNSGKYGYRFIANNYNTNSISLSTICDGMYRPSNADIGIWYASPGIVDTNTMCGIDSYQGIKGSSPSNTFYLRSIVSIPSDYRVVSVADTTTNSFTMPYDINQVNDANPGTLEQEDNLYTINCLEDLVAFAYTVNHNDDLYANKTVKLGQSLDFQDDKSYSNPNAKYELTDYGYIPSETGGTEIKSLLTDTTGIGFVPIGNEKSNGFAGTFDGQNYVVANLYEKPRNYGGLFGKARNTNNYKKYITTEL